MQLFRNQQWVMNLKALASIKMNSSPNSNNAKLKWTRMRKRTGLPHEGFWLLQVTEIGNNSSSWCGPGSELGPKTERQNVSIHFWHVCLFFYNWLVFSFFCSSLLLLLLLLFWSSFKSRHRYGGRSRYDSRQRTKRERRKERTDC